MKLIPGCVYQVRFPQEVVFESLTTAPVKHNEYIFYGIYLGEGDDGELKILILNYIFTFNHSYTYTTGYDEVEVFKTTHKVPYLSDEYQINAQAFYKENLDLICASTCVYGKVESFNIVNYNTKSIEYLAA